MDQCLELLKGPTDERRFVGLLLVTKILKAEDAAAVQAVYNAVGSKFLSRLLLPLHSSQAPFQDPETLEKATGTCAVGLAVLSSICRVPQLAEMTDMIEKVPIFVKVVNNNGITRIIYQQPPASDTEVGGSVDEGAVQDALECLTCVAAASEEGRRVALQSGALGACASLLQAERSSKQLAVRLLVALLDAPERAQVSAEHAGEVAAAVPALAQLLAAGPGVQQGGGDPMALQLEALQALLLVLPIPEGLEAGRMLAEQAEGGSAPWLQAAKRGLQTLLRSRVGPLQRQAALHLTAALLDIAGPAWLLSDSSVAFYQVLVELVKIEVTLLLRDALSPDSLVPVQSEGAPSASQHRRQERPRNAEKEQVEGGDEDTWRLTKEASEAGSSSSSVAGSSSVPGFSTVPGPSSVPGSSPVPGSSSVPVSEPRKPHLEELAGVRAARGLPVLFMLFEGCLEALAAATEAAESAGQEVMSATLPEKVAERAMSTLGETAEAVLQFLEEQHSRQVDDLLALAAARALGRFLAEAPHLEEQRVQAILPWLLTLQDGQALPYLLPLLLQATAPSSSKRSAWLASARSPQVLKQLATHLEAIAQASVTSNMSSTGSMLTDEGPSSLYTCCAVLVNIADIRDDPPAPRSRHIMEEWLVQISKSIADWAHQIWQHPSAAKAIKSRSAEEPRLLVYAGLLCALGLQASADLGPQQSMSPSEALKVSQVVLRGLEVGDVILGMNEEHRSLQQASKLNLSQLAALNVGAENAGLPMEDVPDTDEEDLAEEVRIQWRRTLGVATDLVRAQNPGLTKALKEPSSWVQALMGDSSMQSQQSDKVSAELQTFLEAVKLLQA